MAKVCYAAFRLREGGSRGWDPPDRMEELCQSIRHEFPRDDVMYELRVLRASMAVGNGHIHLEGAIHTEPEVRSNKA